MWGRVPDRGVTAPCTIGLEVAEVNLDITDIHVRSGDEGPHGGHKEPRFS